MKNHRVLTVARALSVAQGLLWLVLLSHGGWGLVFAPLALLAAIFGGRYPVLGPVLLIPPVAWLTLSWVPILADMSAGNWGMWGVLVTPALLAGGLFAVVAMQRFGRGVGTQTAKP